MTCLLVVVTHGRSPTLASTLDSFAANVTPRPEVVYVVDDGGEGHEAHLALEGVHTASLWPQRGFCEATANAWTRAAIIGADYTFWLEHDFTFLRPVDLDALAAVLDERTHLAQMSLCRGPANTVEADAGGLVASRPGQFHQHDQNGLRWMEHHAYWTTNPSLIPARTFELDWPAGPECEGRFGRQVLDTGGSFGLWGGGEQWVEHTGQRNGFGY
jgi:hypothetical protein